MPPLRFSVEAPGLPHRLVKLGGDEPCDREAESTETGKQQLRKRGRSFPGELTGWKVGFDQNRFHNPFCVPSVVPETYQLPCLSCAERSGRLYTVGQQVEPCA